MIRRALHTIGQLNPQARLYFLVLVGMSSVIDGVYNVLLNLYLLRLDYGTEFIGLVNAVGLLTFGCASLPAGILGSRYSNTLLMKVGGALSVVGGLLLPQVQLLPPGLREGSLVILYAMMLIGFSFFFVNSAPYLINVVAPEHKHLAFSLNTAHWALASFGGSLLGGVLPGVFADMQATTLADSAPYRLTLTLAGLIMVFALLLLLRLRPLPVAIQPLKAEASTEPVDTRLWTAAFVSLIAVMTLIRLFQVAGSATVLVYFNVYMDRQLAISTAVIGAIAAVGRLTGVPTALLTPALVKRIGIVNVVLWSSLLTTVFLLPMALIEHWLAAAIGFIGALAVMSVRFTAMTVFILDLVSKSQQSIMAGSGEMAAGLSFAIMSLGGGILLAFFGFRELFLLGALLSFIGALLFWLYARGAKSKRELQPAL